MSILIVVLCIAFLIVLISQFKLNAFLAFLIVSILAGFLLGLDSLKVTGAIQKGIGDMLGGLVIVIVGGAMLGKLVADSGAAQQIASGMMKLFGEKYIQWALMFTGFIIGIPLFYNVGFVLVMPLIFSVVYRYKLPAVFIGLPMLASLSVTHGFLPPHPAPFTLVAQFGADMGTTLLYGVVIGLPTVIIAGPLFASTLKKINAPLLKTFAPSSVPEEKLPGLVNSIISSLFPVILIAATSILKSLIPKGPDTLALHDALSFASDPAMVMLISLLIATFSLGVSLGTPIREIMNCYGEAVKDIAMILLIMSGAGALKQILIESGVSLEIASGLNGLNIHPLVLGWLIACIIRICVGSATVAGLTAAGIIMPFIGQPGVDSSLMVLAIGAGSLMCSHVNDAGFWMFKEYFNLGIKDTIRSWSLMETIVGISGLIGVMLVNALIH
jgi:Gnt-I system high-affinity gluconate transporter